MCTDTLRKRCGKTPQTGSLLLFKLVDGFGEQDLNELFALALAGDNLAGFISGLVYEQNNQDGMAYKAYNVIAFDNHPHALRCYADMLLAGKGCTRDVDADFRMFELSAKGGNAVAMYAMGQKAVKDGDKYLAACWFGMAYSRGMDTSRR